MLDIDDQSFTSTDPPQSTAWDGLLDQKMMASYDQICQPSAAFYSSTSSFSTSPPSSGESPPPRPSKRTPRPLCKSKVAFVDKAERRRQQNRQSQRAYRDRKDKHQRQLEDEIAVWKQKHEELANSYVKQTEELSQLKARIEVLSAQVASLQSSAPESWDSVDLFPPEYDIVSFYEKRAGAWSRESFDS